MPEKEQLQRRMGLFATAAAAVGLMVSSTTLVSSAQGFAAGGGGFIIALVLAMIFNLFVAFTYSELSGLIPKAGGINHYTEAALGKLLGIVAVLGAYLVPLVFAAAVDASLIGMVSETWLPSIDYRILATAMLAILVIINLAGVEFYAAVQMFTSVAMMGSILILGIIGLTTNSPNVIPDAFTPFNPLGWGVLSLLALGFWLFVGTEFVTPLAEEIKNPRRNIPLGMMLGLVVIVICAGIYGLGSVRMNPLDVLLNSPTPHIDAATRILGDAGTTWMSIVTILAAVTTVNTLLCGTARFLYGMALRGQMPAFFGSLNKKGTPWIGILFCGIIVEVMTLLADTTATGFLALILGSMVCYCISYIIAHVDVIVLRLRYPKVHRSFKSPLFPIPQILSMGAMLYMIWTVHPDPGIRSATWLRAGIIMVVIIVWSVVWLKAKKQPLFKPVPLHEVNEDLSAEDAPVEVQIPKPSR